MGHRLGHRHWWRSWLGYVSPSRPRYSTRISEIAVNVTLAFCMGQDLEGIMSSSFGQPMAQIFFSSFGKEGTLAMWSFIIIAQYMMGSSMVRISVHSLRPTASCGSANNHFRCLLRRDNLSPCRLHILVTQ